MPAGIYIASIGGDGGTGGDSYLNLAGGGAAGNGGLVNVTIQSGRTVNTSGTRIYGIFVQSAAGRGGSGGSGFATTGGGGGGGSAASGGPVTLNTAATVNTTGLGAHGILAQSVGGAGGTGGSSFVSVTGAGGGSFGGNGGSVTVTHSGRVQTSGTDAFGVLAQSVGGSGGDAGTSGGTIVSFGNNGGAGGSGSNVSLTAAANSVTITRGNGAVGLFAQSVGGGGGVGGFNIAANVAGSGGLSAGAAVGFGGTGGGAGGFNVAGNLQASGGGTLGAGVGFGGTGGSGGTVAYSQTGNVITQGNQSLGVVLQSIGGGGGAGAFNVAADLAGSGGLSASAGVGFGGNGGAAANGGNVSGSLIGNVDSFGSQSGGIVAQSIGGGGGAGGFNVAASLAGSGGVTAGAAVGFGGSGAFAVAGALSGSGSGAGAVTVGLGGSGNDGGSITGTYSGGLFTTGNSSSGLIAQSIGAGGGEVRLSDIGTSAITLGGDAGASGNGGSISFTQAGDIIAAGDGAFGLIAQSLGGGGWVDRGFAGTAGGTDQGGTVSLDVDGDIDATGINSTAILAHSLGSNGGSAITIGLAGNVRGGSGTGIGLQLAGGAGNIVTSGGTLSAVSRLAMVGTAGNDTLINNGSLFGNVLLGGGNNQLLNTAGASFMIGETVQLRDNPAATGLLRNDGLLMMGLSAPQIPVDVQGGQAQPNQDAAAPARSNLLFGARVVTQTALTGDFVQTGTGRMLADVAFGNQPSDQLRVAGTATMAGTLDVTLIHLADARPYTLVTATGGGAVNGLAVPDTLAMDYSVAGGPAGITLSYVPRFDQPYLWPNGQELGRHMNRALLAGSSAGIGRLMALLGNLRAGEEARFTQLMLQVTPEAWLTPLKLYYQSADSFRRQLMGRNAVDIEEGTLWANGEYDSFGQRSRFDQFAANAESFVLSAGLTGRLGSQWQLTAGGAYRRISRFTVTEGAMAQGDGDAFQVGAVLGFQASEALRLSAGVTGGWQWLRARRATNVFEPISAYVEPQAQFVQIAASASYDWRWKGGYLRPSLDVAATSLTQYRYGEQGLGGMGSEALRHTQWLWSVNPLLSGGITLAQSPGTRVELAARAGGIFQLKDEITMPFRLLGANPAADPAQLVLGLNRAAAIGGADLVINWKERLTLSGGFHTVRGSRDQLTTARIQLRLAF